MALLPPTTLPALRLPAARVPLISFSGEVPISTSPAPASSEAAPQTTALSLQTLLVQTLPHLLVAPCPHPPRIVRWDTLRPPNNNSESSELDTALFNEKLEIIRSDLVAGLPAASQAPDPLTAVSQLCLHIAADRLGTKKCRLQDRVPWWNRGLTRLLCRLR